MTPRHPFRRWYGAFVVLGTAVVLAGCATYEQLYDADGRLDEVAAEPIGRSLYDNRCTLCHARYEPTSYPMNTWDKQLRRYGAKAGLSKEERRLVRLYLDSHAPDGERRAKLAARSERLDP